MRRTVSLFEFMPYGAPELLASRRSHLSFALATASAVAALVFITALQLAPLMRSPIPASDAQHWIVPPPDFTAHRYEPPAPAPVAPARPRVRADAGILVPVPPSEAPPIEPASNAGRPGGETVKGEPDAGSPATSGPGAGEAPLPEFGVYVHVDEILVAITEYKPKYPELARSVGAEGYVVVHALIGRSGRVLDVRLDKVFTNPLFDETALEGARHWVFKPAYSDGHPVPVWTTIPFRFVLRE